MVEGGDLVHLGHRELHLRGERDQVPGREVAVVVLDAVQVLDQKIATARRVPEQRAHFLERLRIDRAALRPGTHFDRPNGNRLAAHVSSLVMFDQ